MLRSRIREREHGMKTVWIAGIVLLATTGAHAQSTIYKHVDESGRVTYSNKPMKGATVVEMDPVMVVPGLPAAVVAEKVGAPRVMPATLTVTKPSLASVEPQLQRKRDEERRRIL